MHCHPAPPQPVHPRPAPTLALLATALAALAGCDGSSPSDGACASIGVPDVGSVTATTPGGQFETACANVTSSDGLLVAIAREPGSGALGGETIELYIDGAEPGTYTFGDDGVSGASYGPSPGATAEARSGSITVESFEGGVRGTFAFVTLTGAEVTGGRFDLDL